MKYNRLKQFRKERKEDIRKIMGDKCCICGYDRCDQSLDLHHIDPKEKEFNVGKILNRNWSKIVFELQKCVLVCKNCHHEIHAGYINPKLKTSFNNDIAIEITKRINANKAKHINHCIECGNVISYGANRCKKCGYETKQKIKYPPKEELEKLICKFGFVGTGRLLGVSDNAIRKRCKKYGLPVKKDFYI